MRLKRRNLGSKLVIAALTFLYVVGYASQAAGQVSDRSKLFSPLAGEQFYQLAYDLKNSPNVTVAGAEQSVLLMFAALQLNPGAGYVLADMIEVISGYDLEVGAGLMPQLLNEYLNESSDLNVTRAGIKYLLGRANSREQREQILASLAEYFAPKNDSVTSQLLMVLGDLSLERDDKKTATYYYMQAYNKNNYNQQAFSRLVELVPDQIDVAMFLGNLRLRVRENPYDIDSSLAMAHYAERLGLYNIAAGTYGYCVELHGWISKGSKTPAGLYLPWLISMYNSPRADFQVIKTASMLRDQGINDLLLEAIAVRAAYRMDDNALAESLSENAIKKAISTDGALLKLAWFYAFGVQDNEEAVDLANQAYAQNPNSAMAASLLAYSLAASEQTSVIGALVEGFPKSQLSELAVAKAFIVEGKKDSAVEALKAAIGYDPGSLEAEVAKKLLKELGASYVPSVDAERVLTSYTSQFEKSPTPKFLKPSERLDVRLNLRGSKFYYGQEFEGALAITNKSSEPIIVSDMAMYTGSIRIDAEVSGDLQRKINKLFIKDVEPSKPLMPGNSYLVPVRLRAGELGEMLSRYPQASLKIKFTAYLDPVAVDGKIVNRLPELEPAQSTVLREKVEITSTYLQNRLSSLNKGQSGQRIRTASLFAGLLKEQIAMSGREPLYPFVYAGWMPQLLKSAVVTSLADDDWVVKVHVATMLLGMELDHELTQAVAANLQDNQWPVRMITIYLLSDVSNGGFKQVLDWTAKNDSNQLVRQMAIALGGDAPKEPLKQGGSQGSRQ